MVSRTRKETPITDQRREEQTGNMVGEDKKGYLFDMSKKKCPKSRQENVGFEPRVREILSQNTIPKGERTILF